MNKSGWQIRSQRNPPEMPVSPADFDLLLYRLGISEKEAVKNPEVRTWVERHYRNRFVPQKLLDAYGLEAIFD